MLIVSRPVAIIVKVPSIKLPVFLAQHRPERDRHCIKNNHPFILDLAPLLFARARECKKEGNLTSFYICKCLLKKDKNVHRFALNAIRGELLERERGREKEREIVLGYYTQVTYYS